MMIVDAPPGNQPCTTCFDNGCGSANCSAGPAWWASADYMFAWMKSAALPPLVTTSPPGTAQGMAGVVGQDSTSTLFGSKDSDGELRSGFRLGLGRWIDSDHTFGIDAGFFMLESQNDLFSGSSTGTPILARPFFNAITNAQDAQLIAFPGVSTGSVNASYRSDNLLSANVTLQEVVPLCNTRWRLMALLGYRWLQFDEKLSVDSTQTSTSGLSPGTQLVVSDRFSAVNVYHGGDFGLRLDYPMNSWSLGLLAKLGVGNITRSVGIVGTTERTLPGGAPTDFTGGLLALSSNIGTHDSSDWVVAPEFGISFGWNIRRNLELRVGYSYLLWSDVARASDQVDFRINPNLIPPPTTPATPARPAFELKLSDIWVQSINVGMEYRF
jgi:hypothetical protein